MDIEYEPDGTFSGGGGGGGGYIFATIPTLHAPKYRYAITNGEWFLWHLSKTIPLLIQYRFWKILYRILYKTEGSKSDKVHSSMTNKCFDSTQKYIFFNEALK